MQWTWRFGALNNERHASLLGLKPFGQWQPVSSDVAPATVGAAAAQWRLSVAIPDLPADHVLVPSFAWLNTSPYGFRCSLLHDGGQAQLSHIGELGLPAHAERVGGGVVAPIDCFVTQAALHNVRIALLLDAATPPTSTALFCLSVRPWHIAPTAGAHSNVTPIVAPALSQRELSTPALQHGACSPVSVAMAMAALGHEVDAETFAAAAQHEGIYGVWPANLYAASRRGALGCIEVFTRIDDAVALLSAGLPVVASTRWQEGELSDGALAQSGGHLILLRGFNAAHALVNDPAGATASAVARNYRRDEFSRIWLRERGAAYVLLPS